MLMSVGMFATTVTWDSNTLSSIYIYNGESFTQDGVTVTSLNGMIEGMYGNWMGNSNDASFNFSTSLGNFTRIEITGNINTLGGSGWTQTSPGAVWTGDANETTFGMYFDNVSQIVFTIGEPTVAVTGVTLNQNEAQMTVGGETLTLTATVNPNNATDQSVLWSTSDANVATVENGVVTAVAAGTATITVTTTDGSFTATCAVTVTAPEPQGETITVTWNSYDLPSSGSTFTKDGVTLTCDIDDDLYGPGTFTTDLGNFTQIVVSAYDFCYIEATGGWSGNINQMTWTGNAASVSFTGSINGYEEGTTLKFTIEPASTPEPAGEVTVVFAANDKTVEKTVTLPHTFSCSYSDKNGELDAIIKDLYEISAGHCSDDNYPEASGNEAVLAGSNGFDNYITISAAFEGTATVSGSYWNSDAYDGDGDWMNYSLTISIKGDEPAPQPSEIGPREELNLGNDYPAGEHYQVTGARSAASWVGIGGDNNATMTIEFLNGEIIDNITLKMYFVSSWGGYSIAATSGAVDSEWNYANYQDLVITGINATSVTLSRVGTGAENASVSFHKIIVNEGSATGVEKVQVEEAQSAKAKKIFRNGKIIIKRNGNTYTVAGARID